MAASRGGINPSGSAHGNSAMKCPICLEIYKDPRVLACLHTFCLDCLTSLFLETKEDGKLKDGIECPVCRRFTKIEKQEVPPDDWAQGLPPNYALVSVLQALSMGSEQHSTLACQPCTRNGKVNSAYALCYSCKEYQCEKCIGDHSKFALMKGHKWTDLDALDGQGETSEFVQLMQCNEHGDEIKFYCTNHDKLCCTTCAIVGHNQCKNVELRNLITDFSDEDVKRDMTNMLREHEHVRAEIDKSEQCVDDDILKIEKKLKLIREKVIKRLDNFENEVRVLVQNKRQAVHSEYKNKRIECQRLIAALEGSIFTVDQVMEKGSQEAKVVVTRKLKQQCEVHRSSIKQLASVKEGVRINLTIGDCLRDLCESNKDIGNVEFVTSEIKLYLQTVSYDLIKSLELQQEKNKPSPFLTGLGFLSDGRVVMVDNKKNECLITNGSLEQLTSIKLKFNPNSLTVISNDEIVITADKAIYCYSMNHNNALVLRNKIKTTVACDSISEMDQDNFLVGCYNTSFPVCKVSRQGELEPMPGDFPDINYGIDVSQSTYSKTTNCVIVTLRFQHEVRVIDTKYNTTTVIKDNEVIKRPRGVVVINGNFCSFYVCSTGTHSIVQLAFNGVVLGCYKLEDMRFPYSIAISKDNKELLVSNSIRGDKKVMLLHLTHN